MWRYVGASLLIGSLVSLLVLVFYEIDFFPYVAAGVANLYQGELGLPATVPGATWRLLQYGVVVVAAFGVAWTSVDIACWSRRALVAGLALAVILGLSVALALRGILFEPVSGGIAVLGSFAAGGIFGASGVGVGQRVLRELMGRRVSARELSQLMASPTKLPLHGEHREATVLVCRIFNDGELRSALEVGELVRAVNLFLRTVSGLIVEKGGFLDHAGPDMVRAVFGAPGRDPRHAERACECALALSGRVGELNRECENRWRQRFDFGIAVVTGTLTFAHFRNYRNGAYAALGWEMDFARRLCGANPRLGSTVLLGPATYASVADSFAARPLDILQDPDSSGGHEIFELLGVASEESAEAKVGREAFWRAMLHLRAGRTEEALEGFKAVAESGQDDLPLEYCIDRARRLDDGIPTPEFDI